MDSQTGYRFYAIAQLGRLHRLGALHDLGFTLAQIRPFLDQDLPVEQLRGMLTMRRAQIAQNLASEQRQLRRVEAHLHALERNLTMPMQDILIKQTESVRIAEATGQVLGFGT